MKWLAAAFTLALMASPISAETVEQDDKIVASFESLHTAMDQLEAALRRLSIRIEENIKQRDALNATLDRLNKRLSEGPKQ